jgi:hypothetical protein
MPDAIQATFGMDLGPLQRGFVEAERIAAAGAPRVQRAIEGASKSAGRSLGAMAGQGARVPINWRNVTPPLTMSQLAQGYSPWRGNFGTSYPAAPPGKYPAPGVVGGGSGSGRDPWALRGLGGRISLVVGLERLANYIEEQWKIAGEIAQKTNSITRLTPGAGSRGSGSITSNLKENIALQEQLFQRNRAETHRGQGRVQEFIGAAQHNVRQFITGESDASEAETVSRLRKAASRDIADSATKQDQLNRARHQALFGDEEQAALLEEEIKNREKLAELAELAVTSGSDNSAALTAENARYEMEKTAIHERFRLKAQEVESEKRIVAIKDEGLTADQKSIALLQQKLQHLKEQQAGAGTVQAKAAFGPEIAGTTNELYRARYAESRKSGSEKLSESIAASREQQDLDYFKRHQAGPENGPMSDKSWRNTFPQRRVGLRGDAHMSPEEIYDLYGAKPSNPIFESLGFGAGNQSDIANFGGGSFMNAPGRSQPRAETGSSGAGRSIEIIGTVAELTKALYMIANKLGIL